MPATTVPSAAAVHTARRRLRIASIAEAFFAVALVVAALAGAPTWELVVLAVLFADAALFGLWQLRTVRRSTAVGGTARAAV